jgi:hypothetical protein
VEATVLIGHDDADLRARAGGDDGLLLGLVALERAGAVAAERELALRPRLVVRDEVVGTDPRRHLPHRSGRRERAAGEHPAGGLVARPLQGERQRGRGDLRFRVIRRLASCVMTIRLSLSTSSVRGGILSEP